MVSMQRAMASFLLLLTLAPVLSPDAGAQTRPGGAGARPDEMVVQAYTFKHQRASEAVSLIYPLLSARGTVALQPGGNTLVITDTPAALSRIVPVLRSFDHPARPLRIEIFVVKASRTPVSPPIRRSDLPEEQTRELRAALPYDIYEVQAQARLQAMEGQSVIYGLGTDFEVKFRLGTLLNGKRVKLSNFRVSKSGNELIHAHLNLWVDQTMNLGLAKHEESAEALILVLTLRPVEPTRRQPKAQP
jgi:hypothetical protein